MIYTELNEHSFAYELSSNKDNGFSYEGAKELYNYFEEFGDDIEFDAIAIRCEYSEQDRDDLISNYAYSAGTEDKELDEEEEWEIVKTYIEENTTLLTAGDDCYILQDF